MCTATPSRITWTSAINKARTKQRKVHTSNDNVPGILLRAGLKKTRYRALLRTPRTQVGSSRVKQVNLTVLYPVLEPFLILQRSASTWNKIYRTIVAMRYSCQDHGNKRFTVPQREDWRDRTRQPPHRNRRVVFTLVSTLHDIYGAP